MAATVIVMAVSTISYIMKCLVVMVIDIDIIGCTVECYIAVAVLEAIDIVVIAVFVNAAVKGYHIHLRP